MGRMLYRRGPAKTQIQNPDLDEVDRVLREEVRFSHHFGYSHGKVSSIQEHAGSVLYTAYPSGSMISFLWEEVTDVFIEDGGMSTVMLGVRV